MFVYGLQRSNNSLCFVDIVVPAVYFLCICKASYKSSITFIISLLFLQKRVTIICYFTQPFLLFTNCRLCILKNRSKINKLFYALSPCRIFSSEYFFRYLAVEGLSCILSKVMKVIKEDAFHV